ncbi:MAG TPA: hypothetical protein VMR79_07300 [Verrucomicrobiae bacterium]|nr:hypothetical protein [Verrucomicrobiae bacterium]
MHAAGRAPAATRPALAKDAASLPSSTDRALSLAAAAVLGALLILLGVEHYWLRGLKFDDAYIHFRYAENIARGEGFVYNPGERVLGSGCVPWNLMLAAVAALVPTGTLPAAVSVLNYLTLLACAALLLAALRELVRPWVGMAITAALLAQGPLVVSSVGGMETACLCLLYLVTFLALLRQRYVLAGLAAGAAVSFRLESVFLAGVAVVAPLLYDRRQLWRALGATLLLPLVVYLWSWLYFGFPLANSTIAKRIVYSPPPRYALRTCLQALADGLQFVELWPGGPIAFRWVQDVRVVLWLPFFCLGYLFVRRRAPAAALVVAQPIGALAFYGVSNPLMFPWYLCTFVPLATLFALLGVTAAGEWVPGRRALGAVATLIAFICLSWRPVAETWWPLVPPTDPRFNALQPNAGPHARVYQYAAIARWLNERVGPSERVCLSEIGALGYYFHGRVLDGLGLVSSEALRYQPTALRSNPLRGTLPPPLVHDLRPEYVVSMDIFAEYLFADPWFQQHYALIGRWPWYGGPVRWHDLPASVWGGVEMRAYRLLDAP